MVGPFVSSSSRKSEYLDKYLRDALDISFHSVFLFFALVICWLRYSIIFLVPLSTGCNSPTTDDVVYAVLDVSLSP